MVCIFAASLVSSIVGQGGGVLYTPIQVWFKSTIYQSATTSLFLIMVMSFSSSITFIKGGRIDWPLALVLESVTTVSAFIGGIFSNRFEENILLFILAVTITIAALPLALNMKRRHDKRPCIGGPMLWRRITNGQQYCVNLLIAIPVSITAGLVSGMVGVGGGILKVAAMVLLLGVPVEIAVASSSFMVGITAMGGFAGHVISGVWEWKTAIPLAVVVFFGAQIGSRISVGLDKKRLERVLGILLLCIALVTVIKMFYK